MSRRVIVDERYEACDRVLILYHRAHRIWYKLMERRIIESGR